jgi:hypothetical protein
MPDLAPWLAVAGLGAFHGANPAMGWLFAVALGLHRQSRRVVWLSLLPIAAGHGLSVAVVLALVVMIGLVVDQRALEVGAGLLLLVWAGYHMLFGHKGRVRFGMRTGMIGLGVWSFLMATSHAAGLMLLPVVLSLCLAATPARELTASGSLPIALAALGVHTGVMLAVTAAIAIAVYEFLGVAFLRRGWINLDFLWTIALVITGLILIL